MPRRSAEGWNVSRKSLEEEQMTKESIVGKGRRAGGRNGPRWKNLMELIRFRGREDRTGAGWLCRRGRDRWILPGTREAERSVRTNAGMITDWSGKAE
jgi:hypothetical protein